MRIPSKTFEYSSKIKESKKSRADNRKFLVSKDFIGENHLRIFDFFF